MRKVELYDGAIPSANAVMAKNLLYLSIVFDEKDMYSKALDMIFSLRDIFTKHPGSFGIWSATAMNLAAGIHEIVIIGTGMIPLLSEVLHLYLPNKVLQASNIPSEMPLLHKKGNFEKNAIYLCRNFECREPVNTVDELIIQLDSPLF